MKSFRELRQTAWNRLVHRWGWRALMSYFLLMFVSNLILHIFAVGVVGEESRSWLTVMKEVAAEGQFATLPSFSADETYRITLVSFADAFALLLVTGMMLFGFRSVLVKAVRNDSERWLASAFGGFRRPFEVMWLFALTIIRIGLWSMLFVIPGIIAAFRYAMAWFVKIDNPALSASECLRESSKLMKGRKLRYFLYSLSYIGWILSVIAIPYIFHGVGLLSGLPILTFIGIQVMIAASLFVFIYFSLGQTAFYEEIRNLNQDTKGNQE